MPIYNFLMINAFSINDWRIVDVTPPNHKYLFNSRAVCNGLIGNVKRIETADDVEISTLKVARDEKNLILTQDAAGLSKLVDTLDAGIAAVKADDSAFGVTLSPCLYLPLERVWCTRYLLIDLSLHCLTTSPIVTPAALRRIDVSCCSFLPVLP